MDGLYASGLVVRYQTIFLCFADVKFKELTDSEFTFAGSCNIVASNDINEKTLTSLNIAGTCRRALVVAQTGLDWSQLHVELCRGLGGVDILQVSMAANVPSRVRLLSSCERIVS